MTHTALVRKMQNADKSKLLWAALFHKGLLQQVRPRFTCQIFTPDALSDITLEGFVSLRLNGRVFPTSWD